MLFVLIGVLAGPPVIDEVAPNATGELGALLGGVTLLVFGAVLLGPALKHVSWQPLGRALVHYRVIPQASVRARTRDH